MASQVVYRNAAPGMAYTGSGACAPCHKDIYEDYVKTDMGRSMSSALGPAASSLLDAVPTAATIYNKDLNRYFQVSHQGSAWYQSEYELNADGSEVFRNTKKIEYIVGSGANGFGGFVRWEGRLFEAPLSYFSKTKTWGASPGFQSADFGFNRPILTPCIGCHSGLPQPVPRRLGLYRDPPFREIAIGCENCHGPGQLHVEERLRGESLSGAVDLSIVNPAKLPSWLADNICMNCHQGGDVRIPQPGKDYSDFRPGSPLDATLAIYKVPLRPESAPQSDLLEHYFSMILSKCYRGSAGRLSCLTCHKPHHQLEAAEAPAYYRSKCLGCHTEKSCPLPLAARLRKSRHDDCAGCHLPKRELPGFSHAALTNHRIVTQAAEPYPEGAFHAAGPDKLDLIHLDAVPGEKNSPPLTLLQAYAQLLMSHPEYREKYLTLLVQLPETQRDSIPVLEGLAQEGLRDGTAEERDEAIHFLSRAIELGATTPLDYKELAELLMSSGRTSEAIEVLKQGITLAPYIDLFYMWLARGYLAQKKYSEAVETMQQALRLFPQSTALREFVKKAQATTPAY
jgi:hypothetical protein